ncbi:hypothetical protein DdX_07834 [Ditylenchus destructor]|uniref:Uncharacterized protein n=1 Tax=Ditylenchus destructor TaxID=166010 RepID=A0AAD4N8N4_9BILA|nr:hypothetical protein DdX_07834 [Ditylenchus destructor]
MNEEEALEDGDEDDVIEEFEDVLTEYLDATDLADRGNEIRAVGDELRRIEVRMQAAAFHPPPPAHHHQHLATRGGWLNELELLAAASAGYVAGIFGGGGAHAAGGVPDNRFGPGRMLTTGFPIGLDANRDAVEPLTHHPMLRRPHTTRLEAVNNILANANSTANGGGPAGMPVLLGDQPNIGEFLNHDTAMQRIMIHRLANSRRAQGLRRQGALRRWYPIGGTQHTTGRATHRLLSRIIDESFFPEINVNMYRPYDDGHSHSQETSAEQRLADAFVPYFLVIVLDE